jgi:hypothetical protein
METSKAGPPIERYQHTIATRFPRDPMSVKPSEDAPPSADVVAVR